MKRRDFLQLMMLAQVQPKLTGDIADQLLATVAPKVYVAPSATSGKGHVFLFMKASNASKVVLRVFDWDSYRSVDYPLPLSLPHSLVQDPTDANYVLVFETFGSFARVDLRTGKSILVDHRSGREMSYGHAAVGGPCSRRKWIPIALMES